MTNDVLAADGRVIGARAQATRRRLLDATAKLLDEHGVLDLKVIDVTREVGTSPATFYQYFADVDAAILALSIEAGDDEAPLQRHFATSWTGEDGLDRARAFVDDFIAHWREHQAVLRVRNLKAEENDPPFRTARRQANLAIIEKMMTMVVEGQRAGRIAEVVDPFAAAAGMLAMAERLLTYEREIVQRGTTPHALRETMATLIYETLTGRSA